MTEFRVEKDSMGEMRVPATALYGPQTQRAVDNFPISGRPLPPEFIHALGLVKTAGCRVNAALGLLEKPVAAAIEQAAREVAGGTWDAEFPIDVFQTGSGTSTNMNANEVIARRASQLAPAGTKAIHPNDHVNLCQSSNDVIPAVLHISAVIAIERDLLPALAKLEQGLGARAREFDGVIKTGGRSSRATRRRSSTALRASRACCPT
jgi:fumarate hydratase class II